MVKPEHRSSPVAAAVQTSRQEPRRLRTHAALMRAGAALLADRPIDAIPVDDIVDAAGVSKGSFFNHFESKDALAEAVSAEIREEINTRVRAANAGIADAAERTARGVCVFVHFALSEPGRARIMLRSNAWVTSARSPLNRGLEADIAESVAQGRFKPRAAGVGAAFAVGLGHTLVFAAANDRLSLAQAASLTRDTLVLALVGLGLEETKAQSLVSRVILAVFEPSSGKAPC